MGIVTPQYTLSALQKCASTWARTRDLSVNSRALCQLSHGGFIDNANCLYPIYIKNGRCKNMVTVGLEPTTLGLLDPCSTI